MAAPVPTPAYRFIHIDNLQGCLERDGLCAPNHRPNDGLVYGRFTTRRFRISGMWQRYPVDRAERSMTMYRSISVTPRP